jgi:hypothetical protein
MLAIKDTKSTFDLKCVQYSAFETIYGYGPIKWIGERKAGIRLVEVLEADNLFPLAGGHDNLRKVGVADKCGQITVSVSIVSSPDDSKFSSIAAVGTHLLILVRSSHLTPSPHSQYI